MIALPDPASFLAFLGAGILLNLTPGSDVMFALASGARGGRRAGIAAAAGIAAGAFVHVALTAFGVAAALRALPGAFDVIRWAGAGYLLYLAVSTWRAPPASRERGMADLPGAFRRGFVTNLLNPKVALFVLAFLPQFADPARGPVWSQLLALGAVFMTTGFVITAAYGAAAGALAEVLRARARAMNRVAALVFAALAVRLAWG
ncbi:Homoserine/homoserine lactone efflux protein [Roseivivax sp. THAF40]|uniref:LysE family translocator n=1 Tax=unclassified Roseivivax TaxID=2639302 RepID=UPI0012A83635|nr:MULTISPECIES: LysE family translocator [unclassified Roseivivax]QFS84402.1 Homoserine/homoserine lactone efflux protein [Roseivivax sp. THAF197b]QFT48230.1 Homoserine/homoserine lactone efflux protein [Roseivivax sp. THAF40]